MERSSVLIVGSRRAASDAVVSLRRARFEAEHASDPVEALERLRANGFALVVIAEACAASRQGLCAAIRDACGELPILLLGADPREREEIGEPFGADDYVVREFDPEEIQTRVRLLLRRSQARPVRHRSASPTVECGPLWLHTGTHAVSFRGRTEQLTAIEYQLLRYLARSPGRICSHHELLRAVWGYAHAGYAHTVMTHVSRLRAKLERGLGAPRVVETLRGRGYRFADPPGDGPPK